jgi:hypothetical protein
VWLLVEPDLELDSSSVSRLRIQDELAANSTGTVAHTHETLTVILTGDVKAPTVADSRHHLNLPGIGLVAEEFKDADDLAAQQDRKGENAVQPFFGRGFLACSPRQCCVSLQPTPLSLK